MKKHGLLVALILAFCIAAPSFAAAEDDLVKHGELAQLLTRVLGLHRHVPSNPTDADCFAVLKVNGISPAEGWQHGKVVTTGDLARVVVQAMGQASEIEDPDDPAAWVEHLNRQNITLVELDQAVAEVMPLDEAVTATFEPVNVDPFTRRRRVAEPDEHQLAGDFGVLAIEVPFGELVRVIRVIEPPRRRRPVPVTPVEPEDREGENGDETPFEHGNSKLL